MLRIDWKPGKERTIPNWLCNLRKEVFHLKRNEGVGLWNNNIQNSTIAYRQLFLNQLPMTVKQKQLCHLPTMRMPPKHFSNFTSDKCHCCFFISRGRFSHISYRSLQSTTLLVTKLPFDRNIPGIIDRRKYGGTSSIISRVTAPEYR